MQLLYAIIIKLEKTGKYVKNFFTIVFLATGFLSVDATALKWVKRLGYTASITSCTSFAGYMTYKHKFPHLFHAEWKVDKRPITTSWPRETVKWLRNYEVPFSLKREIDKMLSDKDTLQLLSKIYSSNDLLYHHQAKQFDLPNGYLDVEKWVAYSDAWNADVTKTYAILKARGFEFFGTSPGKGFVFKNQQVPGYVFKIEPQEVNNVARIEKALTLTEQVQKAGNNSIKVPLKYVYFVDQVPAGVDYENIPKAIVVAKALYPKTSPTTQEWEQYGKDTKLLEQIGFKDAHYDNVYVTDKGTAVVDTESVEREGDHAIPGLFLSEREGYLNLPSTNDKLPQHIIIRWNLSPTWLHERTIFSGDKGLIAYRLKPAITQKLKTIPEFLCNTLYGVKATQLSPRKPV